MNFYLAYGPSIYNIILDDNIHMLDADDIMYSMTENTIDINGNLYSMNSKDKVVLAEPFDEYNDIIYNNLVLNKCLIVHSW